MDDRSRHPALGKACSFVMQQPAQGPHQGCTAQCKPIPSCIETQAADGLPGRAQGVQQCKLRHLHRRPKCELGWMGHSDMDEPQPRWLSHRRESRIAHVRCPWNPCAGAVLKTETVTPCACGLHLVKAKGAIAEAQREHADVVVQVGAGGHSAGLAKQVALQQLPVPACSEQTSGAGQTLRSVAARALCCLVLLQGGDLWCALCASWHGAAMHTLAGNQLAAEEQPGACLHTSSSA